MSPKKYKNKFLKMVPNYICAAVIYCSIVAFIKDQASLFLHGLVREKPKCTVTK